MNCQEVRDLLFVFQEGETAPSERAAVQAHVLECDGCRTEMNAISSVQDLVRRSLQVSAAQASPSAQAWRSLKKRLNNSVDLDTDNCQNLIGGPAAGRRRWMMSLSTRLPRWVPVTAVVLLALVTAFALIPPLRTAAQDPLGIFRVKRFTAVTVDPSTLPSVKADPTAFGSLTIIQTPQMAKVSSLSEAQGMVDFAVRSPKNLPAGVTPSEVSVSKEGRFSYTFDLQKAREYLASMGIALTNLPAELDGATIKLTIPAQVVTRYGPADGTHPVLMLTQGHSPVLEAPPGLDVETVRNQMLSLPGLPPELVSQLQALEDWRQTAVVPLPKEGVTSNEVAVDGGMRGLQLQEKDGDARALLLWEKNGIVYIVAGELAPDQLLAVANSMSP